jgi:preprotein translocase subunit SecD
VAAPKRASNPWRPLAVITVALIALYLGVFFGKTHTPALGLDLKGGTTVLLQPKNLEGGGKLTSDQISRSVEILSQRVNANGVSNATVVPEGSCCIRINVPGQGRGVIDKVDQTALVRFRQVLAVTSGTPTPPTTAPSGSATPAPSGSASASSSGSAPSPTVSASESPKAGASASAPSVSATSNGRALPQQFLAAGSASATPSASASKAATPSSSASPSAAATPGPATTVNGVPLYTSTDAIDASTSFDINGKQQTLNDLMNNAACPPSGAKEIAAVVPDNDADATKPVVACGRDGGKYLLGPQLFPGDQINTAYAGLQSQSAVSWTVNMELKSQGAATFGKATTAVVNYSSPFNQIAVVLDGVVESAPVIQSAITDGNAQITGNFSQSDATNLANILKFGALPVAFDVGPASTISPSLGSDQLRAGLIAGAIALVLVILYSLLYYRFLGIVTVASLLVSGALLYAMLVVLGHTLNYTLTLPGIAGFIIAVGITADSFVVYFERLRDEIRDGRTARVAVERGWERARRTILSADFVSILAAAVLYFVSIGDVRGFAFTLGLSTLSDLVIVFLFTKPIITLLVRSKFFSNHPRLSGLADRVDRPQAPSAPIVPAGSEA